MTKDQFKKNGVGTSFVKLLMIFIFVIAGYFIISSTWHFFFQRITLKPMYLSVNAEYLENQLDVISETFNDEIKDSLNVLLLSIAIITLLLTGFAIAFAYNFFGRLKEINKAYDKILDSPKVLMSAYYKNQLQEMYIDLFADDNIKRSNAIKLLSQNPEVKDKNFEGISKVLLNEFNHEHNPFFYHNVSYLIAVLYNIDEKKSNKLIFELADKYKDDTVKCSIFLQYLIAVKEDQYRVLNYGYISGESVLGTQILTTLIVSSSNNLDKDYFKNIVINANSRNFQTLVTLMAQNYELANKLKFQDCIYEREQISSDCIEILFANKEFKNIISNPKKLIIRCYHELNALEPKHETAIYYVIENEWLSKNEVKLIFEEMGKIHFFNDAEKKYTLKD